MAALEELTTTLQSLSTLKPPGVTPTKVKAITQICVDNIQYDKVLIEKILLQYSNSPATHKLGVLYVVDSVIRQWVEKAKKAGQAVSKQAAPGTYASGVQLVREALPVVLKDLVKNAPETQKEKISKLLDIWQRGQTFPPDMIASMKQLVNGTSNNAPAAHSGQLLSNGTQQAYNTQANQQSVPPPPPAPAVQPQQDQSSLYAAFAALGHQNSQTNGAPPAPPSLSFPQSMVPPPPPGFVPPPPPGATGQPALPPPPAGTNDMTGQILQAMSAGLIAPDQAIQVLNAMAAAQNGGAPLPSLQSVAAQPAQLVFPDPHSQGPQNGAQPERYDPNESRYRDRSRSPDYQRRQPSPPRRSPPNVNRRESPTYGVYDPNAGSDGNTPSRFDRGERGRGRGKQRGGRNDRNEYRQRSPARRQPSPPRNSYGNSKYIEWDSNLPRDHIRVLSRTLFVGGAGGTEGEIRSIFSRFGQVQTCIVNLEKRHAFVKMLTRPDAVHAKEGMDNLQDAVAQSKARQTRWGVGFGPRDCSDYQSGISVIPISRLTDADRKWALTAEHGGTGGRPLEGGMVLEEPDIEIGAGVSSKAISRRVPTDAPRGGGRGNFNGGRGNGENGHKHRKQQQQQQQQQPHQQHQHQQPHHHQQDHRLAHDPRHVSPRPEPMIAVPPAVPGFGFQLPGFG
ncbi:hypothetical protein HBI24_066460 [Parastagonospora nodorum]|nr:hypothetical protein HBH53_007700 [Parastagonospora nodorum]KAH3976850.1 hypothetical protein HBH51_073820 [Parastagonospora nodorum]KAH3982476.1 hypothetical protein HBH52_080660 [Parastagonospora nodorum]KAH4007984.1 hypothetical protein HBI10_001690 [Parastagonospora nodorum]KAH4016548.1 hypothetical protein HBI13_149700 [Parastagonospora nodorum]